MCQTRKQMRTGCTVTYPPMYTCFRHLQWMEAGVRGENGAHALNRVALDHRTAKDRAPGLLHRTEVNSVLGRTNRRGTATHITALVRSRSWCAEEYAWFFFHRPSQTQSLSAIFVLSVNPNAAKCEQTKVVYYVLLPLQLHLKMIKWLQKKLFPGDKRMSRTLPSRFLY